MAFTPAALRFFRGLAKNNNKEWFEAHRAEYESEVREPMRELIGEMDARFVKFAPEIGGDPKRSMFRINRDIRFSKRQVAVQDARGLLVPSPARARGWAAKRRRGSAGFYFICSRENLVGRRALDAAATVEQAARRDRRGPRGIRAGGEPLCRVVSAASTTKPCSSGCRAVSPRIIRRRVAAISVVHERGRLLTDAEVTRLAAAGAAGGATSSGCFRSSAG